MVDIRINVCHPTEISVEAISTEGAPSELCENPLPNSNLSAVRQFLAVDISPESSSFDVDSYNNPNTSCRSPVIHKVNNVNKDDHYFHLNQIDIVGDNEFDSDSITLHSQDTSLDVEIKYNPIAVSESDTFGEHNYIDPSISQAVIKTENSSNSSTEEYNSESSFVYSTTLPAKQPSYNELIAGHADDNKSLTVSRDDFNSQNIQDECDPIACDEYHFDNISLITLDIYRSIIGHLFD